MSMFDMDNAPQEKLRGEAVEVGDVYPNQRGGCFVIIAVRQSTCYYIGIDTAGNVVSTGQYSEPALLRRALLGRAAIPEGIDIEWFVQ